MTTLQPSTKFGVVPPAVAMQTDGLTFLRDVIAQNHPAPPFAETTLKLFNGYEFAGHGRTLPRQDRSHKPWREADRRA